MGSPATSAAAPATSRSLRRSSTRRTAERHTKRVPPVQRPPAGPIRHPRRTPASRRSDLGRAGMTLTEPGTNGHDIGSSPHRGGGLERVTGTQEYVADIRLDDVLHVKLVTVDAPRARIDRIETGAALAVPGVRLIMTAADLPQPMPRFGPQFRDRPVLAVGETKYHGDPVAAVAADTLHAAEEGARRGRGKFEPLPALVTVATSLRASAPLVQDPSLRGGGPPSGTNVLREHR